MRILNKLLLVTLLIGFSSSIRAQNYSDKVSIEYLNFEKFGNSSIRFLFYFKIKNNTAETLYLSRKNIIITVTKKEKLLMNEPNTSSGLVFHTASKKNKPKVDAENENDEKTKSLRHNFAKKLYYKNFTKYKLVSDKEFVVSVIESDCIVILPKSTVNYSRVFINNLFTRDCKVKAKYDDNKIFTYYMSGADNKVNIKR